MKTIAVSREMVGRPWQISVDDDDQMWLCWSKNGRNCRVAVKDFDHAMVWADAIGQDRSHEYVAWVNRQVARGKVYANLQGQS